MALRSKAPVRMGQDDEGIRRHVFRRKEQTTGAIPAGKVPCLQKFKCGACKYVGDDYERGLLAKHNKGLATLRGAELLTTARVAKACPSPLQSEYRSLFKLAVRPDRAGRFGIGLFKPGTHDLIEIDSCPLHVMALKRLIPDLRQLFNDSELTPYNEQTHSGDVRYVVARAAHMTGEVMLTFVTTSDKKVVLKDIVRGLRSRYHKINSAHMNINPEISNAIFGDHTIKLAGNDALRERVCDLDFDVAPTAFFQINPWQAERLYRRVEQIAGPAAKGEVAWDFYCGAGQLSLILSRLGYKVLGIEENLEAVRNANTNARKNNLAERSHFLAGRVEDVQKDAPVWAKAPKLIVVNPSRRGLAQAVRSELALASLRAGARIIYVSCNIDTLTRDLTDLCRAGLQARQIESFDMFPQTDKMEWVAVLTP